MHRDKAQQTCSGFSPESSSGSRSSLLLSASHHGSGRPVMQLTKIVQNGGHLSAFLFSYGIDRKGKVNIMNVTTVTLEKKNGSLSFSRNACLHHHLVWSSHLIDWDSFIFLCDRDLAVPANRAGNHIHDHDLLFEHTKNRAQPLRGRAGRPLESETDNDGQRSGGRHYDYHHSFSDVERLAGNLAFIRVAGFVE